MTPRESKSALDALEVARRCVETSAPSAVRGSDGNIDALNAAWNALGSVDVTRDVFEAVSRLMLTVLSCVATARQEGYDEARKESEKTAQEAAPSKRSERRAPRFVVLSICAVVFLTFCYLRWQGGCIVVFLTVLYVFGWREPLKTIRELPPS